MLKTLLTRAKAEEELADFKAGQQEAGLIEKTPPDEYDGRNDERAAWAHAALVTYMQLVKGDAEDAVGDLMADLHHWCDRHGLDFEAEASKAEDFYHEEIS